MRPDKAEKLKAWAEPSGDAAYPDRDALLAAEMGKGEALFGQRDDLADTEVDRLTARYGAVVNREKGPATPFPRPGGTFKRRARPFWGRSSWRAATSTGR